MIAPLTKTRIFRTIQGRLWGRKPVINKMTIPPRTINDRVCSEWDWK